VLRPDDEGHDRTMARADADAMAGLHQVLVNL
jgi:hypothetical protein